jgi:hypothetical protein
MMMPSQKMALGGISLESLTHTERGLQFASEFTGIFKVANAKP